jgi:hypothetical protein
VASISKLFKKNNNKTKQYNTRPEQETEPTNLTTSTKGPKEPEPLRPVLLLCCAD